MMKKQYVAVVLGAVAAAVGAGKLPGIGAAAVYAEEAQSVEVSDAPEVQDVEVSDAPEEQDAEASDAPEVQDTDAPAASDREKGEAPAEPPAKPEGEKGGPPAMPGDGQAPNGETGGFLAGMEGEAPAMPEGGRGGEPPAMPGGGMGGPGQMSGGVEGYEAVNTYTEDAQVEGEAIRSTGADENAVLVSEGAEVSLENVAVSRSSQDSTGGDNSSFYGVGAAVLATDGTVTVKDSVIDTDSSGGAGVFAYGEGTAYVMDTAITTKKDTSGGIHAAGGGTLYAWDLTVDTSGESSAAIRSDRGGGTMVVEGGSYTSNGVGSPAVYSTADIAVCGAELAANGSEAVCIEGLNSLRLFDCTLSGNMADDLQNDCTWNVILYQSMSGDSEVGNSTFEMSGGTLEAKNGGIFYTTNTESTFILDGVQIAAPEDHEFFLRCTGNQNLRGWGSTGQNGADCSFTAISQEMQGDVVWDSISTLDIYLTQGSTLTGAILDDESCAGEGGDGSCSLAISADSRWEVTGDSALTNLSCAGTIADSQGKEVTVAGTDGTIYVEGTSPYTVTVESYEDSADLSGASSGTAWTDYQAELPQ